MKPGDRISPSIPGRNSTGVCGTLLRYDSETRTFWVRHCDGEVLGWGNGPRPNGWEGSIQPYHGWCPRCDHK